MSIYAVIFITLIAALLVSFSQILFKKGLKDRLHTRWDMLRLAKNKMIVAGVLIYLVAFVIYLYALSAADLSFVYPTFAASFIFIAILSSVFLKEKLGMLRILGVVLIFLGIAIVAVTT
ncbi:MAG TPA: EamA family transporter [Candidatus Acidoferrales bacterium]|nr:EamA family transporter [Candidatus Acidoferrales bacterium]